MSTMRYFSLVVVVLLVGGLLVGTAFAAVSGEELELRKKEVIRESLQKLGRPTEDSALLEAAAQAEALLEIKIERGARETRVSILTTDEPAYESFVLQDRHRTVIDLYNTINFHSGDTYKATPPSVVKSVRTSLFELEPQFISRVVLDLEKTVEIQIVQRGRNIEVIVPEDIQVSATAPSAPETPAELGTKEEQLAEQKAEAAAMDQKIEPEVPAEQPSIEEKREKTIRSEEIREKLERAEADLEERKVLAAKLEKELDAERAARAAVEKKLKGKFEAEKSEALAAAEQKLKQLEQALVEAGKVAKAESEAEINEIQKQLDYQKEAYAKLKAGFDAESHKRVSELEKKELESKEALESQKIAVAELEERLAAEVAQKERLAKQLAERLDTTARPAKEAQRERKQVISSAVPDLTEQKVTLNFRDADLGAVLDILSRKANVNLLSGRDVTGKVTARLVDVPLMKAMELVLRENGYGLVHEDGIYRVVPLQLAEEMGVATTTETFKLEYAKASDMAIVLKDIVTAKGKVVADDNANIVVVTDDPGNVPRIADVIEEIDVPQTIVDTVTGTFRLSYLDASPTAQMLEKIVTDHGGVIADETTNTVILTDVPANFQVVSDLIGELDQRPDQVYIKVLMVDAVLSDDSEFGVKWLAEALREHHGGNLSQLDFGTPLGNVGTEALNAAMLTLGILSGDFQLDATIAAEVRSSKATILADPRVLVVNNETATIEIVKEEPFQEITQSTQGPPVASTEFKDIGTTLKVTPRITHENTIMLRVLPEQSSISRYTESGIPVEDSRRADTSILLDDGQTAVIGGLRRISNSNTITKVPWLGDIPFFGRLFRNTVTAQATTELLVFLTVHIVKGVPPELTPYERTRFTEIDSVPKVPDATRELWDDMKRPWGDRMPFWKRRTRKR